MIFKNLIKTAIEDLRTGADIKAILQGLKDAILEKYTNELTRKSALTKARTALKDAGFLDQDRILALDVKQYSKINTAYQAKRNNQALNLIEIEKETAQAIIQKAVTLLSDASYLKRLAAVLLLTGRRTIEIAKTGKFVEVKLRDYVRFLGVAKKRDEKIHSCKIYLLGGDLATIKAITKEVQARCKGKTATQINGLLAANLIKAISQEFPELQADSAHELRKFYAACIKDMFPRKNTNLLLSSVLGHSENDLSAALSYEKYVLV